MWVCAYECKDHLRPEATDPPVTGVVTTCSGCWELNLVPGKSS